MVNLFDLLPYMKFRSTNNGLIYVEDDKLVLREHSGVVGPEFISALICLPFGFGKYEWTAKVDRVHLGIAQFVGLFERHHGWAGEDGIFICAWNDFRIYTGNEQLVLTNVDFTRDTRFVVDWKANEILLTVNGVLQTPLRSVIPQKPMNVLFEIGIPQGITSNSETRIEVRDINFPRPPYGYFRQDR